NDVASAGDFGVFSRREAARIALALQAYADRERSPLPGAIFDTSYPEQTAELYVRLLAILPNLLIEPERFRRLWEREDASITATEAAISSGEVRIEARADLDFATVRLSEQTAPCHPFALHTRTPCTRLLIVHGQHVELQY